VRKKGAILSATALVVFIALCKLAVQLYAAPHYGYFRDELYYLACARHLAWGYVDQPPLIALVAWLVRSVLGDSLTAIRLLPAIAGACEVALAGLLARELGGKRFAQGMTALATLTAPGILGIDSILSMNAFEPLFWLGCAWLVIRIVKTGNQKLWIWFGLLAGVGLENKYSMLIFGAGVVFGVVLTPQRRALRSPWFWIAGAIALLIFLPNLLWNIQHHFPFLELQANIRRSGRDVPLGPLAFFGQEILAMEPLSLPLWIAGLWFYFFTESGKPFRVLGWAWVFTAAVIVIQSPRIYYLFPAFPVLFAGGAVVFEMWLDGPRLAGLKRGLRIAWPALLAGTAVLLAPLAIPVLPPETYLRYTKTLHLAQPAIENHALGPLPQIYADEFGWEEMAATVARVYNALPADLRARTAIFGQNYGQAGAIDFFGPRYGLPPAISGHQSYYLWGPRNYTGESMIVLDDRKANLEKLFAHVTDVAHVYHPYSMPYEHFDVFYCTGPKMSLKEVWPQLKRWG
jgi:4-amino-4-deoxy-L-arabinose transferase-like glycosyltransferase